MAKNNKDADSVEVKPKKNKNLIIILIVLVVLMIIGISILTFFLFSSNPAANAEHDDSEKNNVEAQAIIDNHEIKYDGNYKQLPPPAEGTTPLYFTMDKLVVNFLGDGVAKFLAVDLKFMSYYVDLVKEDGEMESLRPILKNDIEELLREQHYNDLNTDDGPDKLRAKILQTTRNVMEQHRLYPKLVLNVYMTRFIMQ